MKKKILLPVLLLCVSTVLVAQRSSLIYAITAPDKQTNWENIQLLNSKEGVVLQTVFDPSKQKISVTDAVSNTPITRTVNGKPIGPTATTCRCSHGECTTSGRQSGWRDRIGPVSRST